MTRLHTEITVVGDDETGIIARVTTLLFERGINIEDLDQAVRDGVDPDDYQLGLPAEMAELNPDGPIDSPGRDLSDD